MRFKPRLASRLMIAITIVSAVVAPAHYGPPPPYVITFLRHLGRKRSLFSSWQHLGGV